MGTDDALVAVLPKTGTPCRHTSNRASEDPRHARERQLKTRPCWLLSSCFRFGASGCSRRRLTWALTATLAARYVPRGVPPSRHARS